MYVCAPKKNDIVKKKEKTSSSRQFITSAEIYPADQSTYILLADTQLPLQSYYLTQYKYVDKEIHKSESLRHSITVADVLNAAIFTFVFLLQ